MGWTGVDMSTPLLPEAISEIDANPVSFYFGGWGCLWTPLGLHPETPVIGLRCPHACPPNFFDLTTPLDGSTFQNMLEKSFQMLRFSRKKEKAVADCCCGLLTAAAINGEEPAGPSEGGTYVTRYYYCWN